MRFLVTTLCLAAAFAIPAGAAWSADLTQWFLTATAAETSGPSAGTVKPEFLGGRSMHAEHCGANGVRLAGVWQLIKYDRTHHIALAAASTDQCSVAVFEAATPGVNLPDADLAGYATGRGGIHIGSAYREVIAAYGGAPPKHASRLVLRYTARIPDETVGTPHKHISDDEVLTIVIDNDRVTSITSYIDLSGEF